MYNIEKRPLFSSLLLLLLLLLVVLPVPSVVRGRRVVLGRAAAADLQGRGLHRVAVVRPLAVGDAVGGGAAGGASARAWK